MTARDLAESAIGGLTDQNHTGGAAATRSLGAVVGIESGWKVLDIGTGLGGTPRLLSEEYGCYCHGIEITQTRYRDAIELTGLVGLADRVSFTKGDILTVDVPLAPFDLVIAQGSLMHCPELPTVLARIATLLRPNGTLVVEDGVILRMPTDQNERIAIDQLSYIWNGHFQHVNDWPQLLESAGLRHIQTTDMTDIAMKDFVDLLATIDNCLPSSATPDERNGWALGYQLLRSRQIGTARVQAVRPQI